MKTKLFFVICFLIMTGIRLNAQINFLAPGATWHYLVPSGGWGFPYVENNRVIKYAGDSVYMGRQTKILTGVSYFNTSCSNWYDTLLIYTSNDSVFMHGSKLVNDWELLYDFNASVGQSWQLYVNDYNGVDTISVKVDSIKYNSINALSLKTLYVTYTETWHVNGSSSQIRYHSSIYDRIGDIGYLFNYDAGILADPCYVPTLLCYSDNTFGTYQVDSNKSCNYSYTEGITNFMLSSENVNVYPNPASNNLQITVSNEQITELKINDVLGKEVKHEVLDRRENTAQTDINNLPNGVYFIEIKTGTNNYKQKVVVQH